MLSTLRPDAAERAGLKEGEAGFGRVETVGEKGLYSRSSISGVVPDVTTQPAVAAFR